MFGGILKKYFSHMGVALSKSFVKYTSGIISSCSFSTNERARHVSKKTGHDVNTSVKGLHYLLCNNNSFEYLIRTTADFKVKNENDGEGIFQNLALKDGTYHFQALTWQKI